MAVSDDTSMLAREKRVYHYSYLAGQRSHNVRPEQRVVAASPKNFPMRRLHLTYTRTTQAPGATLLS